jgi:hypothetical protein
MYDESYDDMTTSSHKEERDDPIIAWIDRSRWIDRVWGVAWRGVAWRGVAWRGVGRVMHIMVVGGPVLSVTFHCMLAVVVFSRLAGSLSLSPPPLPARVAVSGASGG